MERCLASYRWAHEPRPGVLNGKWLGCYWDDMGPGHRYEVRLDQWQSTAIDTLTRYIKEIIDGASNAPMDTGLLRNYLTDQDSRGMGLGSYNLPNGCPSARRPSTRHTLLGQTASAASLESKTGTRMSEQMEL